MILVATGAILSQIPIHVVDVAEIFQSFGDEREFTVGKAQVKKGVTVTVSRNRGEIPLSVGNVVERVQVMVMNRVAKIEFQLVPFVGDNVRRHDNTGLETIVPVFISKHCGASLLNLVGTEPERESEITVFAELECGRFAETKRIVVAHRKSFPDLSVCYKSVGKNSVFTGEVADRGVNIPLEGEVGDQILFAGEFLNRNGRIDLGIVVFRKLSDKMLEDIGCGIAIARITGHSAFGNVLARNNQRNCIAVL